jgi:signal transduction histidine kinase
MESLLTILIIILALALVFLLIAVFVLYKKYYNLKCASNYMAHEMKNCITALKGEIEIHEMKNKSSDSNLTKRINKKIDSINRLILTTHNLFKNSKNTKNEVLLNELINREIDNLRPLILKKEINCQTEIKDNILYNIFETDFNIILRNLLINAVKFSPHNGKINITAGKRNKYFFIEIKNEREKIPVNEKKLFEGTGLKITSMLLKKYKGTIKVLYEGNSGFTAIIYLPV